MVEKLGITCVENCLLWILQNKPILEKLYCNSFIEIDKAIEDFNTTEIGYENYQGIKRIQDIGSELKCINKSYYDNISFDNLLNLLAENSSYILAGMKPEFIKNKFNITPWREDHFIYINNIKENEMFYFNDTPMCNTSSPIEEVKDGLNGKCLVFTINHNLDELSLYKMITTTVQDILNITIETSRVDGMKTKTLRDAIGILRISRKRIKKLYNLQILKIYIQNHIEFHKAIDETIVQMDMFYTILEYYHLRNRVMAEKDITENIKLIKSTDNKWRSSFKNNIKGVL